MVNYRFSKNMHYPVQIPLCSRLHDHYIHYSIAHIHKTITITEALSQYHRLCHNTLEWPSIILGVCIHSVCLMCMLKQQVTFALLLLGMTHVTRHEKDGKGYVERVPESEQGFKHLTECEDMVLDSPSLLH